MVELKESRQEERPDLTLLVLKSAEVRFGVSFDYASEMHRLNPASTWRILNRATQANGGNAYSLERYVRCRRTAAYVLVWPSSVTRTAAFA